MSSSNKLSGSFDEPNALVKANFDPAGKLYKVLDLGSGRGFDALYLARLGHKVTAIDNYAPWLEQLRDAATREDLHLRCVLADAQAYHADEDYDAILALMLLHYMTPADIKTTLANMKQWTAPGGRNLITVLTTDNPEGTRPYLFTLDELKNYYADWTIQDASIQETEPFVPQGEDEPVQYKYAQLIATKPQS